MLEICDLFIIEGAFQMTYINSQNSFEHPNTNGLELDGAAVIFLNFGFPQLRNLWKCAAFLKGTHLFKSNIHPLRPSICEYEIKTLESG